MPGLPYSPRQLFWVSYARLQCELRRPAALKNQVTGSQSSIFAEGITAQVLTDNHAPARIRINGPLANQPEFSQVLTLHQHSFKEYLRTGAVLLGPP